MKEDNRTQRSNTMDKLDLIDVLQDLKIFIKEVVFPEIEDEKWVIGKNVIAHKKHQRRYDIVKMYFKEKSHFLEVHLSRYVREHRDKITKKCLELLAKHRISCVVDINGKLTTSDYQQSTVLLYELIETFKQHGRPEHMLKMKWSPLSNNNDPRLEVKRGGKVIFVFRSKEEIQKYAKKRDEMSAEISKLKRDITEKLKHLYPEASLTDEKRILYQGVKVFYNIREIITSTGSVYRQRVDDIKWDSEELSHEDTFIEHIQTQIKKQRLKKLFY